MKKIFLPIVMAIVCLSCAAQTNNNIFGNLNTIGILKNNKLEFYYRDLTELRSFSNWELKELQFTNWQKSDVTDFILPEGYKAILDVSRMSDDRYTTTILVDNRIQMNVYENNDWRISGERNITLPTKYKYCFFDSSKFYLFVFLRNELLTYDIYNDRQVGNFKNFVLLNGYKNVFPSGLVGRNNLTAPFIGVHAANDKIQFYRSSSDDWKIMMDLTFNLPRESKSVFSISNGFGVFVNNEIRFFLNNYENKNWVEMTDWAFILPEHNTGGGTQRQSNTIGGAELEKSTETIPSLGTEIKNETSINLDNEETPIKIWGWSKEGNVGITELEETGAGYYIKAFIFNAVDDKVLWEKSILRSDSDFTSFLDNFQNVCSQQFGIEMQETSLLIPSGLSIRHNGKTYNIAVNTVMDEDYMVKRYSVVVETTGKGKQCCLRIVFCHLPHIFLGIL